MGEDSSRQGKDSGEQKQVCNVRKRARRLV